jgi:hypothetical protein
MINISTYDIHGTYINQSEGGFQYHSNDYFATRTINNGKQLSNGKIIEESNTGQ